MRLSFWMWLRRKLQGRNVRTWSRQQWWYTPNKSRREPLGTRKTIELRFPVCSGKGLWTRSNKLNKGRSRLHFESPKGTSQHSTVLCLEFCSLMLGDMVCFLDLLLDNKHSEERIASPMSVATQHPKAHLTSLSLHILARAATGCPEAFSVAMCLPALKHQGILLPVVRQC